jgi:hypothetical protein
MRAVRVLEAAASEAVEAAAWYEARRRGLGADFRSEFKLVLDRIRDRKPRKGQRTVWLVGVFEKHRSWMLVGRIE